MNKAFISGFTGAFFGVALAVVCLGAMESVKSTRVEQDKTRIEQWWSSLSADEKDTAKLFMDPATVDTVFASLTANQRKWLKASVRLHQVEIWLADPRAREVLDY